MSAEVASDDADRRESLTGRAVQVLRGREQAEAYVASVCFKHGPPRLIGVELEWLLERRSEGSAPGPRLDVAVLGAALGPHTPTSLDPRSAALPLPNGSGVTVEPGGQVELASPPRPDLDSLFELVTADAARLHTGLARHGLRPRRWAADPDLPPQRLLRTPRYTAMECAFDRLGDEGRSMMCSTAAVQPCFDLGERADLVARWEVLHQLGPVLVAAFANSPALHGRRTGWRSSRMACWLALDPPRTAPPELGESDPAAGYARRAMAASVICRRGTGPSWVAPPGVSFADWLAGALPTPPTTDDLDLHLSTLFPPVRPHGHVEVRYLDAQPGDDWIVPVAVLAALLSGPDTVAAAREVCRPVAGDWERAARLGLTDPELARTANTVFDLALDALPRVCGPGPVRELVDRFTATRVRRGLCPADADLDSGRDADTGGAGSGRNGTGGPERGRGEEW